MAKYISRIVEIEALRITSVTSVDKHTSDVILEDLSKMKIVSNEKISVHDFINVTDISNPYHMPAKIIDGPDAKYEKSIKESSEQNIEQKLQEKGLSAPRLSPADIDAVIVGETFTNLPSGKAMVCEITLRNGFTVRGESACVSKENFDQEIGQEISRKDARDKIWGFEAYLLQEKISE